MSLCPSNGESPSNSCGEYAESFLLSTRQKLPETSCHVLSDSVPIAFHRSNASISFNYELLNALMGYSQ